ARMDVDLEESVAQVHAADAIAVDRDEIRIRRGAVLLHLMQREPIAQVVGAYRAVALELDRFEKLLSGMMHRVMACGRPYRERERKRYAVRFHHGHLEGCSRSRSRSAFLRRLDTITGIASSASVTAAI